MRPEQKFYQWFRDLFEHDMHVVRIENTLEAGMPDVNVCADGRECWVELKVTNQSRPIIRKEQYAWAARRTRAGGRVVLLAYDEYHDGIKCWNYDERFAVTSRLDGKVLAVVSPATRTLEKSQKLDLFLFMFPLKTNPDK